MTKRNDICVKVYFNKDAFKEIAEKAEKAGKRHRGLKLYTQKKDGFAGQLEPNRDGISKFLKYCASYWEEHESERMSKAAELIKQERHIQEEKKRLGIL